MIYGQRIFAFDKAVNEAAETPKDFNITLDISTRDISLIESVEDYLLNKESEEFVTEGANSEYTDAIKEVVNDYRDDIKQARKLFKDGQYSKAKASYQKAEKDAKDIEKKIESVKSDDVMSAIIGYFIASGISLAQVIVVALTVYIPIVGLATSITQVIQAAEEYKQFFKDLKTKGINEKSLNLYRNKLLAFVKTLIDAAKLGQDACDAKSKK